MEGQRFDALVRQLVVPAPRRAALRALAGAALAAIVAGRGSEEVAAAEPVRCPEAGCFAVCRDAVGPGDSPCACVRLKSGKRACVVPICGRRCRKTDDCPRGEVCSTTAANCCDSSAEGRCVRPCKRGNPGGARVTARSGWGRSAR